MSRWTELFQNHEVWVNWNALKNNLRSISFPPDIDSLVIDEAARLQKVVTYLDSTFAQFDPELTPQGILDSINQHIVNCVTEVNGYISSPNVKHLMNANNNIDSVISIVSRTPFILTGQQKGALKKAVDAHSEAIAKSIDKLLSLIDKAIATEKQRITELAKNVNALGNDLTGLNNQVNTVQQTIQKQTAEFNTQFQNSEKDRTERFNTVASKLESKVEDESSKLESKLDEEFKKLATKAAVTLEVLNTFKEQAESVYDVTINTMQAGAYSSYANEERGIANKLRYFAIGLMLVGVSILVGPELLKISREAAEYTFDWKAILGRIPISAILFVPAFYIARESGKHRATEVVNRRRELILSTIGPYLALLPPAKAQEVKAEIAKEIFSESSISSESTVGEAGNLISQLANLAKQLKN